MDTDVELHLHVDPAPEMDVSSEAVETDKAPAYDGEYSVTPDLDGEMLEVRGFKMTNDLEVKPIPVSEASNPQGGYTLTIS